MSIRESRKMRRQAQRAALNSVAAAPSFKAVNKKRTRRSPLRRSLVITTLLSLMIAMLVAAPKMVQAAGPVGGDAPEIDPTAMSGALTLLAGGFLALTDRLRRA